MEMKKAAAHHLFEKLSDNFKLVVKPTSKNPATIR
jgi:hypothetical protein